MCGCGGKELQRAPGRHVTCALPNGCANAAASRPEMRARAAPPSCKALPLGVRVHSGWESCHVLLPPVNQPLTTPCLDSDPPSLAHCAHLLHHLHKRLLTQARRAAVRLIRRLRPLQEVARGRVGPLPGVAALRGEVELRDGYERPLHARATCAGNSQQWHTTSRARASRWHHSINCCKLAKLEPHAPFTLKAPAATPCSWLVPQFLLRRRCCCARQGHAHTLHGHLAGFRKALGMQPLTRFWLPPSVVVDLRAGDSGVPGDRVLDGEMGGCRVAGR